MQESFAEVLGEFVNGANQTPGRLSELTGVPSKTIASWLEGRVARPRSWEGIIRLADALRLTVPEASRLLEAAGHKSIAVLMAEAQQRQHQEHLQLLSRWNTGARVGGVDSPNLIPSETVIDFYGRKTEQQHVIKALRGGARICAIHGMGGVGKSTLARRIARQLIPYFPDGILWADLDENAIGRDERAPVSDERLIDIFRSFVESFGGSIGNYNSLSNYQEKTREVLRNKQALIVLDNVNHQRELEALRIADGTVCSLLITTHNRDIVARAMPQADIVDLKPFAETEGVAFLQKLIDPAERHLLSESQSRELVRLVEGHPLALRSLGSSLKNNLNVITTTEFIRLLQDNLSERLTHASAGIQGNSLWVTFDMSYWLLSPDQRALFTSLVVFRGPTFSTEAVAAVTQRNLLDVSSHLHALAGQAFIEALPAGRFRMHSLLRLFAEQKASEEATLLPDAAVIDLPPQLVKNLRTTLTACGPAQNNQLLRAVFIDRRLRPWRDHAPEGESVGERIDGLINHLSDKFNQIDGRNGLVLFLEVARERLEEGDGCISQLTALSEALEREINTQLQRPQSLTWHLWQRAAHYFSNFALVNSSNYLKLSEEWQNVMGVLVWSYKNEQWPHVIRGMSYLTHSNVGAWGFLDARGHWYEARKGLKWMLVAAEAGQDIFRQAEAHMKLGVFAFHFSEIAEAESHLQESLRLLAAVRPGAEQAIYQARACELMAQLLTSRDSSEAAVWIQHGLDALEGYDGERIQQERGYLMIRQATILGRAGQLDEALEKTQVGLTLLPQSPTHARLSGLISLGAIHYFRGNIQDAYDVWHAAVADARMLGDRQREAKVQQNLGAIYSVQGNYPASIAAYQEAAQAYHQIGDAYGESEALASQTINHIILGQDEQGWTTVAEALRLAREHELLQPEANALINRAQLQLRAGGFEPACIDLARAEKLARELEDDVLLSESLVLQARLAFEEGQYSEGLILAEEGIAASVEPAAMGKAYRVQAELLSALGRTVEAEHAFSQSAELLAEQEPYELAQTQRVWAQHRLNIGDIEKGTRLLEQARAILSELDLHEM